MERRELAWLWFTDGLWRP